jgi:FdhD protein
MIRATQRGQRVTTDLVVREEPLEIQVGAVALTVTMRTPGHDEELATGFLLSEGVIADARDIIALHHDRLTASPAAEDNVLRVHLRPDLAVELTRLRRSGYTSASCGVCGTTTIAQALRTAPPLTDDAVFRSAHFTALPDRLRATQAAFTETGGLHAAALVAPDGTLLVTREDVGRHNAVDKVIGWAVREGRLPLSGHLLLVSGRISFEIVQKALAARLPVIAAVSAPSSLAIDLATAAGMLLIGFLRRDRLNAYATVARLLPD